LLARVGRVSELHSVQTGCFGTDSDTLDGVDLDFRNGEVGQIHKSILNLWARGVFIVLDCTRWGVVEDRASSEVSAKHVRESQGEERISRCRAQCDDELNISCGVLATVAGGIVTERTDAGVAVISSVATITFASLGATLVPHLVIGVGVRVVLTVHVHVAEAATMTTAVIRAGGTAAATSAETIEALALSCCVVAGSTARALGVHVEVRAHGVQLLESGGEISVLNRVSVGCLCVVLVVTNKATWSTEDNILRVSVVHQFLLRGHAPRRSDRAVAVAAITSEEAFVAMAHITGTTRTMSTASVGAAGVGKANDSSNSQEQLHR